jgi:hypothetical protein
MSATMTGAVMFDDLFLQESQAYQSQMKRHIVN